MLFCGLPFSVKIIIPYLQNGGFFTFKKRLKSREGEVGRGGRYMSNFVGSKRKEKEWKKNEKMDVDKCVDNVEKISANFP